MSDAREGEENLMKKRETGGTLRRQKRRMWL